MSRGSSIVIGILLGALASGIGVGIFLHRANQDRVRLAEQARLNLEETTRLHTENRRLIEETNQRLTEAAQQITASKTLIDSLQSERALVSQAIPLATPTARSLVGWSDIVAFDQKFSLKIPPGLHLHLNTETTLTLTDDSGQDVFTVEKQVENSQSHGGADRLAATSSVAYVTQDSLWQGSRVKHGDSRMSLYILYRQKNGSLTHTLAARLAPTSRLNEKTFLIMLASMRFP